MEEKQKEKNEFESLLEESFQKRKTVAPGAEYMANVIGLKNKYIFIDAEGIQGIIPEEEFILSGRQIPKKGENIKTYFLGENHGDYIFTIAIDPEKSDESMLELALAYAVPVLGSIAGKIKGGYSIKLGSYSAFCPESQMEESPEISESGKLQFIITEIKKNGLVVSRKRLKEKEAEEKRENLKQELSIGSVVNCRVVSVKPFGLIVSVDGVDAMIPKSEASFQFGAALTFKPGEKLKARVMELNWVEKKILLSLKDFLPDPWAKIPFREGEVVEVTIQSIKPFGIFVKLNENFQGLVPSREILEKNPKPGDKISVFIMQIDAVKRQIALSQKKAAESTDRENFESFLSRSDAPSTSSFGSILKKALDK